MPYLVNKPCAGPAIAEKIALEEEVRRLRKDNERLRQERDILKKAVAIVSEGPK
jgi:transposase